MSLIGPRPCPNCGGMVPEGGMLAHICRPSSSDSEALRLLREARVRAAPDSTWAQVPVIEIDALLARPDGPEPCSIEGMIASERARADKDNAAGQERQPSDQGRVNAVRSPQAATTPAPAAPAEAPMLTTDAVIGTIRFVAVKTGISATTVGAICHDVRSIVGDLERRFHAALERERLAKKNHALALGDLDDANERERLANMRADQAEEAREAAQSASGAIREIAAERERQREKEGWDDEHDDAHAGGSLTLAALCYCQHAAGQLGKPKSVVRGIPPFWPWEEHWWKPKDARRNLVRAAALLAAEIERMDRAALASTSEREGRDG